MVSSPGENATFVGADPAGALDHETVGAGSLGRSGSRVMSRGHVSPGRFMMRSLASSQIRWLTTLARSDDSESDPQLGCSSPISNCVGVSGMNAGLPVGKRPCQPAESWRVTTGASPVMSSGSSEPKTCQCQSIRRSRVRGSSRSIVRKYDSRGVGSERWWL